MKQRNGKIELFRFVFCIAVIFFHLNLTYFDLEYQFGDYISFFKHGRIGVEFFFVVTGYLFAYSVYKRREKAVDSLGKDTIRFVFHKWFSVFPQHVVAFFITFLTIIVVEKLNVIEGIVCLIQGLPNFFLIQKTGIYTKNIIGVEWYVSVMLLSLFILYPFAKKNYDIFVRIVAPLVGIFLVGYLCHEYGHLANISTWGEGIVAKVQLRGIAEICLGAFAFEVSRFIQKFTFSFCQKIMLSIIEWGCYLCVLLFACSTMDDKYEAYALYALVVGVCLSFSNLTLGNKYFQNKICFFLGKMSLPIYLAQNAVRLVVENYCQDGLRILYQFGLVLAGCFVLALFIYFVGDILQTKMMTSFTKLASKVVN